MISPESEPTITQRSITTKLRNLAYSGYNLIRSAVYPIFIFNHFFLNTFICTNHVINNYGEQVKCSMCYLVKLLMNKVDLSWVDVDIMSRQCFFDICLITF
jgi:hypothetical protein